MCRDRLAANLFVALVGPPAGGKGGSESVGRDAIVFTGHGAATDLPELPVGSAEGIARTFDINSASPTDRAIFTAAEVDTLAALFQRQASTLEGELRKVWMGERLGSPTRKSTPAPT